MRSAQIFRIPQRVSTAQQVAYCLAIIEKQRAEVTPLRQQLSHCQQYHTPLIEETKKWKEKYNKEKKKKEQWKESYEKAQQEIADLHKQIEKLTKTENRLNQALFAHGNFHHPQQGDKKPQGGQYGHKDTNEDTKRNTASFQRQRIYATHCGKCGNPLGRVRSIKEKTLIDIQISTKLIEIVLHSVCSLSNPSLLYQPPASPDHHNAPEGELALSLCQKEDGAQRHQLFRFLRKEFIYGNKVVIRLLFPRLHAAWQIVSVFLDFSNLLYGRYR